MHLRHGRICPFLLRLGLLTLCLVIALLVMFVKCPCNLPVPLICFCGNSAAPCSVLFQVKLQIMIWAVRLHSIQYVPRSSQNLSPLQSWSPNLQYCVFTYSAVLYQREWVCVCVYVGLTTDRKSLLQCVRWSVVKCQEPVLSSIVWWLTGTYWTLSRKQRGRKLKLNFCAS